MSPIRPVGTRGTDRRPPEPAPGPHRGGPVAGHDTPPDQGAAPYGARPRHDQAPPATGGPHEHRRAAPEQAHPQGVRPEQAPERPASSGPENAWDTAPGSGRAAPSSGDRAPGQPQPGANGAPAGADAPAPYAPRRPEPAATDQPAAPGTGFDAQRRGDGAHTTYAADRPGSAPPGGDNGAAPSRHVGTRPEAPPAGGVSTAAPDGGGDISGPSGAGRPGAGASGPSGSSEPAQQAASGPGFSAFGHSPSGTGGAAPADAGGASAAPSATTSARAGGDKASPDAILIRRTMAEIEPIADKVTSYFYAMLFVQHPYLRALFPAAMDSQRDRLFKALLTAAKHVDDSETLTDYLAHLGRGHRKYGTAPEHYPAVGECLLLALSRYAPGSWSAETEAAWVRAYTAISQIMIDAAAENERHAPAWWDAEVVAHDLRTPDIAIVTVRPDQPYPFRAGQYTTLETPWWPRVWRHYSFASAPRSDGLLSFHVKAVPAGWVSGSLVHRARPGDIVRLGPPGGSMTVDHSNDNGLLCLGGGTGIAPIKALVEDVAEHGRKRAVEVFYGARNDHDLYDIDTMLRLQQSHSWLSVRPVVSNGPTTGLSGPLPDAVRQYGPWNAYDAYLSGPPGMIRSGVDTLVGIGIPSHRIRHDSIEELVAAGD
ncbi:globin domain-containing protein [Streptomyces sp. NPDC004647]|uniref:globin domain-containing protein n=1 Tax=Streptomyces sp. NPDC004647 TaxID=3154671 RepID=UPI0033B4F030